VAVGQLRRSLCEDRPRGFRPEGLVICVEMNEVVKVLRGDQLYRGYERGRGEDGIFGSHRTYALQHGIHEAGVAMIDEARRQICVLLPLLLLFDRSEEFLV